MGSIHPEKRAIKESSLITHNLNNMAKNKQLLHVAQRTVVFSDEEARAIHHLMIAFNPDDVTEAIENVFLELLNHMSDIAADFGTEYYTLLEVRTFYKKLKSSLTPVYEAFKKLPNELKYERKY